MKFWLVCFGICLAATAGCASGEPISALLRSVAGGGPVPAPEVFNRTVNENSLGALSDDDLRKQVLPLAGKLLHDPRPKAREYGLMCFMEITLPHPPVGFRETTDLMEPYVPDLLEILDEHTLPFRNMAYFALANTLPRVSPKTLAYMSAHLADKNNTPAQAGGMACLLLMQQSEPLTHQVIEFAREQNRHETVENVLNCFARNVRTKSADALAFIGSRLDDPDAWIRRRAAEAVGSLPPGDRAAFFDQLNRLANDPKEPSEVRAAAADALKK